ncbi:hypothetical protein Bca4012_002129 [Brassica carinata]
MKGLSVAAISKCVAKEMSSPILKSFETRGRYSLIDETEQSELLVLHINDLSENCLNIFGKVLQIGAHTFSVMFVHYILSHQVVIEKDFELWCLV